MNFAILRVCVMRICNAACGIVQVNIIQVTSKRTPGLGEIPLLCSQSDRYPVQCSQVGKVSTLPWSL